MRLARRMGRLGNENAFVVLAEVTKLKEQGRDIVNFGVGEPDFDTPLNIKNVGIKAINDNMTHYSPPAGVPDFRRSVARYISATRNIDIDMDNVIITPSTKPAIFNAISALIDSGDEVIYPNPGYPIYESLINYVGGKSVPLPLLEEKEFSFDINDLKKAITGKTRMIIINSPQNPTGGILSKEDLNAIAKIAIENDIWVMSDEIYSRIVYDGEFNSIISIKFGQANIPIIAVDVPTPNAPFMGVNNFKVAYAAGQEAIKYVEKMGGIDKIDNIILMQMPSAGEVVMLRSEGFYQAFAD